MTEKTKSQLIRESNISTYTSMLSKEDLLIKMFENSAVVEDKKFGKELKKNRSLATKFSQLLESITIEPITTQQLLKTFYEEAENEEDIKCIEKMGSFVKIVHAEDYKLLEKPKKIKNNKYQNLKDTAFVIKKEKLVKSPPQTNQINNKLVQNTYYEYKNTYGIHTGSNVGELYDMETLSNGKSTNPTKHFVNRRDQDGNLLETRLNTSLSFIMIDNPNLRVGTKNSLELNTFFNSLSTIELSKCIPFFDVQFILPSLVQTKGSNTYKTASITQFLFGTPYSKKPENHPVTNTFRSLSANFARNIETKGNILRQEAVETNMSAFTMPQTVNNFDEKYVGHLDNIGEGGDAGFKRQNSIHDYTRPFMTIKNFSVDIAPTQGLMSFKTGKISLVLHDRTRMSEIAPFIKPDLFGSFGAEIVVTYGWSHIDGMDNNSENFLGRFLDKSKVREKYIITNSTFNIDSNGQVNIDLSIAMRGPIDIRSQTIKSSAANKIKEDNVKTASESYRLQLEEVRTTTDNDVTIDLSPFTDLIMSEIRSYKNKKDLQTNLQLIAHSGHPNTIKKFKSEIDKLRNNNALKSTDVTDAIDKLYYVNSNTIVGGYNRIPIVLKTKFEENSKETITSNNSPYEKVYSTQSQNSRFQSISLKSKIITLLESLAVYLEECYNSYVTNQMEEQKRVGKVTESIMKNISSNDVIDPFFNKDWVREYYKSITDDRFREQREYARKGFIPTNNNIIGNVEYVTFGKFISSIIGSHMSCSGKFDEIQILSYTANDNAGLMSNLNLASLLIPLQELKEFIESMFISGGEMTLEGVLVQVINRFIITSTQLCYGFSYLYKRENNVVKQVIEDSVVHRTNYNNRLRDIYNSLSGKNVPLANNTESIKNVEFVMPRIKLSFDTLVVGQKTICRISILDQNDNPYKASSSLLKDAMNKNLFEKTYQLNKLRNDLEYKVKTQPTQSAAARLQYIKESKNLVDEMERGGLISKVTENIKDASGKMIPRTYHKITSLDSLNNIKRIIKETMPSITYGTQNSAIIDASVTTVNESRLNAVYLTRADRNADKTNNEAFIKFTEDMPLRVMPQQANITIFGCPFVNFAQYMFLDFETGTTVDNQYAITGVKHDFSPGKFTTSLTLSYGDIYGKYENVVDSLSKALSEQRKANIEKLEEEARKEKERNEKSKKANTPNQTQTITPTPVKKLTNNSVPLIQDQETIDAEYARDQQRMEAAEAATLDQPSPAQPSPAQPYPQVSQQQASLTAGSTDESFTIITQSVIDDINDPNNLKIPADLIDNDAIKILDELSNYLNAKAKIYTPNRTRSKKLLPLAHEILTELTKEAKAAGFKHPRQFELLSGLRSYKYQKGLFEDEVRDQKKYLKQEILYQNRAKIKNKIMTEEQALQQYYSDAEAIFAAYHLVSIPGSSHHHEGNTFDIRVHPDLRMTASQAKAMRATPQWNWLVNKSKIRRKYIIIPMEYEPWHMEFPVKNQIKYLRDKGRLNDQKEAELLDLDFKYKKYLGPLIEANNLYRVKLVELLSIDTLQMKSKVKYSENGKRSVISTNFFDRKIKLHKRKYSPSKREGFLKQLKAPNSLATKKRKPRKNFRKPFKPTKITLDSLSKLNIKLNPTNFKSSKEYVLGVIANDENLNYNKKNIKYKKEFEFFNNKGKDFTSIEVKTFNYNKSIAFLKQNNNKILLYIGSKQNEEVLLNINLYDLSKSRELYFDSLNIALLRQYFRLLVLLSINNEVSILDKNSKIFKIKDSINKDSVKKYAKTLASFKETNEIKKLYNFSFYKEVNEWSVTEALGDQDSEDEMDMGMSNSDNNRLSSSRTIQLKTIGGGDDSTSSLSPSDLKMNLNELGRSLSFYPCKPDWFGEKILKAPSDVPLIYTVGEPIFDIEIFHVFKNSFAESMSDQNFVNIFDRRKEFFNILMPILFKCTLSLQISKDAKIKDFKIKHEDQDKLSDKSISDLQKLFTKNLNPKFVKKLTDDNKFVNLPTSDLKLLNNEPRIKKIYFDNQGLVTEIVKTGTVTLTNGKLSFKLDKKIVSYNEILSGMKMLSFFD